MVEVTLLDSDGLTVPDADTIVTFTLTGDAALAGTGNGDPADHTPDKSPTRAAFHGKVMAVIAGGETSSTIVITATAPGLPPVTLSLVQEIPLMDFKAFWCHQNPRL